MITVTVEFTRANPPKIIRKEFKDRKGLEYFITTIDGSDFYVSTDDGTLGLWVGSQQTRRPK